MNRLIRGTLLVAIALVASVTQGEGYDYKADGKDYHLDVTPADKESEAIIKKYKLHNLVTSLGNVRHAGNSELAETEIRPIIVGNKIYLRDGYITITNEDFKKLVGRAAKRFADLKTAKWKAIKDGLTRRDWARPILKDGEFVEGSFFLHKTIIAYWNDQVEAVDTPTIKKKRKKRRNKKNEKNKGM